MFLRVSVNKVHLLPERIMPGLNGVYCSETEVWFCESLTDPYRARASCMQQWKQQLNFRLWQYLYFCQLTKVLLLLRLLPVLAPWIPRYPVKHIYQIFTWFSKDSQTFFYLGIIWVGTSLTRLCWYAPVVLGCFLWGELFASCKRVRIPQTGKFLLVESEILGLGIRNTTQRIRNPTKDCNPESKFHWQNEINNLESGIRGVKFKIQDCLGFPFKGRNFRWTFRFKSVFWD